jgi:hypothetical protein
MDAARRRSRGVTSLSRRTSGSRSADADDQDDDPNHGTDTGAVRATALILPMLLRPADRASAGP